MSLVTLIKSVDTTLRDAVVQIEEWSLPKEAIATGNVDEAGRAVFTLLKTEVAEVKADIKADVAVVETDLKKDVPVANTVLTRLEAEVESLANTGESDVENLINEVEGEAKKIAAKVTGFFHKANT